MRTNRLDNSTTIFNEGDMFCDRCGQIVPKTTWEKAKSRGRDNWDHCQDCKATPRQRIKWLHAILGNIECHPFDGELDELWRPIDDEGQLYKPGERMCGLKDCVNRNHIVGQTHHRRKKITDLELLLTMVEVQDYNKRARTR